MSSILYLDREYSISNGYYPLRYMVLIDFQTVCSPYLTQCVCFLTVQQCASYTHRLSLSLSGYIPSRLFSFHSLYTGPMNQLCVVIENPESFSVFPFKSEIDHSRLRVCTTYLLLCSMPMPMTQCTSVFFDLKEDNNFRSFSLKNLSSHPPVLRFIIKITTVTLPFFFRICVCTLDVVRPHLDYYQVCVIIPNHRSSSSKLRHHSPLLALCVGDLSHFDTNYFCWTILEQFDTIY